MRRFLLPGLVVAAAVALLALLTFGVSKQTDASSIDSKVARGKFPLAPSANQALPILGKNGTASLADFRGKVVVLNMFASWCDPCQAEAPILAKEQAILAKHNATLVGVTYKDLSSSAEAFDQRYHITYPVLRDVSGNFAQSYGTDGVPETFVINRQGRIQAVEREPVTTQWLNEKLTPLLGASS